MDRRGFLVDRPVGPKKPDSDQMERVDRSTKSTDHEGETRWDRIIRDDPELHRLLMGWLELGCPDPECGAMINEPHIADCTFNRWSLELVDG